PTTPHLDGLAERSVVFEQHYAHSSRTGPSMASVFTGLHGPSHGVINPLDAFDAKGTLAESQVVLAELLSAAGWSTQGFVANINVSARFGFSQGFDGYQHARATAEEINRAAKDWLGKRGTQPYFLYLHYMETHSPYQVPGGSTAFVDPAYSGPVDGSHEQLDSILKGDLSLNAEDQAHLVGLYDQSLAYFDAQFGALLGFMETQGHLENTLVVFLSDHGEEFFEHGAVLHGYTLYEEQLHVPFIVLQPGSEAARVSRRTRHVDVMPTILDMLELDHPEGLQGTSLVNHSAGEGAELPVYAQTQIQAVKTAQVESFTDGQRKLIRQTLPVERSELFDLADDPREAQTLASPAGDMREKLEAFKKSLPRAETVEVQLTREEMESLKALGYLE
ncbi:MAG: sulfatase, partial [Myxococcota bacterium]|nr:sulfatase [Myxococcota bacterium]